MISVDQIWGKGLVEKRALLEAACEKIAVPSSLGLDPDLHHAYQLTAVLNQFIKPYLLKSIELDLASKSILEPKKLAVALDEAINAFYPKALTELKKALPDREALKRNAKNLYEVAGARKLAFGNNATRTLSTTIGLLAERLANISPYAINPEVEFGIKLKGIDVIYYDVGAQKVFFAQLKTQKNTLTGSQKGRSISELSLHKNPSFCACFETKTGWTFNHGEIPRLVGHEFWNKIGINYELVLGKVSQLILRLEDDYVEILSKAD